MVQWELGRRGKEMRSDCADGISSLIISDTVKTRMTLPTELPNIIPCSGKIWRVQNLVDLSENVFGGF